MNPDYCDNTFVQSDIHLSSTASIPEPNLIVDLEAFMIENDVPKPCSSKSIAVEDSLRALCSQDRMHSSTNVLGYWHLKKYSEPELSTIATGVYSAAATQVSVERSFSSLPIILNKMRLKLTAKNLTNILLVRLNNDLLDLIDND